VGKAAEAAAEARRSLALARELGYPAGEAVALAHLAVAVYRTDNLDRAVQLAWHAEQTPADIPGRIAQTHSNFLALVLTEAGELAAAGRICAAGLARSREAGDPWNQARLLVQMATLDLRAAQIQDAAAHLQEALQLSARTGDQFELRNGLDCCGYVCAATGRYAEAVMVWAAHAAIFRHDGYSHPPAEARRRKEILREVRQALGPGRTRAAEERGTAMSRDTATEYALMLTAPGTPLPSAAPSPGQLSARERQIAGSGVTCGRPSRRTVDSQNISVCDSTPATSVQGRAAAPGSLNPSFSSAVGSASGIGVLLYRGSRACTPPNRRHARAELIAAGCRSHEPSLPEHPIRVPAPVARITLNQFTSRMG
jgi:hypothetical protein